MKGKEDPCLS